MGKLIDLGSAKQDDPIYTSGPMDAQQEHDLENSKRPLRIAPRAELEALLAKNEESFSSAESFDPIEWAMKRHPGLTREKAEQMASDFGF